MKALLVFVAMSANAADLDALKRSYYEQRTICRLGEDATQSEAACEILESIGKKLTDAGLCWDGSELVWSDCRL